MMRVVKRQKNADIHKRLLLTFLIIYECILFSLDGIRLRRLLWKLIFIKCDEY